MRRRIDDYNWVQVLNKKVRNFCGNEQNIARSCLFRLRLVGLVNTLDRQIIILCGNLGDHLAFELLSPPMHPLERDE